MGFTDLSARWSYALGALVVLAELPGPLLQATQLAGLQAPGVVARVPALRARRLGPHAAAAAGLTQAPPRLPAAPPGHFRRRGAPARRRPGPDRGPGTRAPLPRRSRAWR